MNKDKQKKLLFDLIIGIGTVLLLGYGLHVHQMHNAADLRKKQALSEQRLQQCEAQLQPYYQLAIAEMANPGTSSAGASLYQTYEHELGSCVYH